MELKGGGGPPPGQQTKMSGTISPRDRLQLWVNTCLLKQKENSGSVTATFRDMEGSTINMLAADASLFSATKMDQPLSSYKLSSL